ncbi:MAG: hypothetical protein ACRDTC_27075 [Pseudonocardiaceae bacterium]
MDPLNVPRLDQPPANALPRAVRFHDARTPPAAQGFLGRRGFLAVLSASAMTLGVTMLGWIPLARPARAEAGTEFPDCGVYADGAGGPICVGAPYSASYCGSDKWFKTGCYSSPDGDVCYEPAAFCRAAGRDGERRNAWRWEADGVTYRCADGRERHAGAPNPETVICSATLSSPPSSSQTPPPEPTPFEPTPDPEPSRLIPRLPILGS